MVLFCAGIAEGSHNFAGGDIKPRNQGLCAMTDIFIFAQHDLARFHGPVGCSTLQGLDACHLVNRKSPATLFCKLLRLPVDLANICIFFVKLFVRFFVEPVADAMGLEVGLFLKSAPRTGAKFALQYCAGWLQQPGQVVTSGSMAGHPPFQQVSRKPGL